MIVENKVQPSAEQIKGFQEGDTDTPIAMLNLLKFKERASYEDGRETSASGADAYRIYAGEVAAHVEKVGGKMIFGGQVSRLMLGEVEDLWDSVALVMYPSRKAMFTMIQDPDYQASAVHRKAGLAGQLNIELKGDLGMDHL
jgi:uncharacterized protein (DUF1330 family)